MKKLFSILILLTITVFLSLNTYLYAQETSSIQNEEILQEYIQKKNKSEINLKRIRERLDNLRDRISDAKEKKRPQKKIKESYRSLKKHRNKLNELLLEEQHKRTREETKKLQKEREGLKELSLAERNKDNTVELLEEALIETWKMEITEVRRLKKHLAMIAKHSSGTQKKEALKAKRNMSRQLYDISRRWFRFIWAFDATNRKMDGIITGEMIGDLILGVDQNISLSSVTLFLSYKIHIHEYIKPHFGISNIIVDPPGMDDASGFYGYFSSIRYMLGIDWFINETIEPGIIIELDKNNELWISIGIGIKFGQINISHRNY